MGWTFVLRALLPPKVLLSNDEDVNQLPLLQSPLRLRDIDSRIYFSFVALVLLICVEHPLCLA